MVLTLTKINLAYGMGWKFCIVVDYKYNALAGLSIYWLNNILIYMLDSYWYGWIFI